MFAQIPNKKIKKRKKFANVPYFLRSIYFSIILEIIYNYI